MTVHDAAASGDRLATLQNLRDLIAEKIDACESMRDIPALAARLQAVMDQIADLDVKDAGDGIDEIAQRRAARRAGTAKGAVRSGGAS